MIILIQAPKKQGGVQLMFGMLSPFMEHPKTFKL